MLKIAAVLAFALFLALTACSSSTSPVTNQGSSFAGAPGVAPAAPAAPAAAPPEPASGAPDAAGSTTAQVAVPFDRMVIRQGTLNITVKDPIAEVQAITTITEGAGGYVASTNFQNSGDQQTSTMTIQVPSQSYDTVVANIRGLALKVNQETSTSQDVTQQFVDLGAQLHNLQATESQYLTLMTKAQTVADIIKVQEQLTTVQGQIERLQGQINYLQHKSDLSQIDITMIPEEQQALDPKLQSPFLNAVKTGWEGSIKALTVIVTIVVFLWWMIPLAGIVYGIVWFVRRRFPRQPGPTKAAMTP